MEILELTENYLGKHILAEYYGCDKNILNSVDSIEKIMTESAETANVTIVEKCFHKFSPYGVSGVIVITESHLAIHTWPEYNYAAVDFFTCNKNCDTELALEKLQLLLKAEKYTSKLIKRGTIDNIN